MIKEMLPNDVRVTNDARDMILDCMSEFVQMLASESNQVCDTDGKKMISTDHVLRALQVLGFSDYVKDVQEAQEGHKEARVNRPRMANNLTLSGLSQEELIRQQQELFSKARQNQMSIHAASATPTSAMVTTPLPLPTAAQPPNLALGSESQAAQPAQPAAVSAPVLVELKRKAADEEDYDQ
ncbi:hypothetical protein, variant [Capsaspora owczarzaki ATCC 30864]|nr:hypothetical protein, variant [Capsaspora owczarzaki ATCC 30864]|eukprot:XP_011270057.1 hypothetical protein, variant [Capsaspora owczarzaki ATCC 30864]